MRKKRGWSLLEAMVALGLAGVVLLVISSALTSTARVTSLESRRGLMQARLQTITASLEQNIQRTCAAGIAWQAASPTQNAALILHPQQGSAAWSGYYLAYIWQSAARKMLYREDPSGLTAPSTTRVQVPTVAEIRALAASPPNNCRMLSEGVSNFTYTLDTGPLVHLFVEVEIDIPNSTSKEKCHADKLFQLRNRI